MLKIKLKCRINQLAGIVHHVYVKYFHIIILKMINHLLMLSIIAVSVIDWLICYSNHLNSILRTTTLHCLILMPEMNFYNKIDLHINSNCNYYMEEEFSMVLKNRYNICPTENRLSLCYINIRNLQANLHSFEKYLENIDIKFSCVGVTETWLQDHTWDLYNLNRYGLIENHRQTPRGGGVGIYFKKIFLI